MPHRQFSYCNDRDLLIRTSTGKPVITRASGKHYVKVWAEEKCFQYHNIVWLCCGNIIPEGFTVDHIDNNKLNNTISNLRLANKAQQMYNTRSYGITSKYKGVDFNKKASKFFARIMVAGENVWLGSYELEEDANHAYAVASKIYHGEFANINGEK